MASHEPLWGRALLAPSFEGCPHSTLSPTPLDPSQPHVTSCNLKEYFKDQLRVRPSHQCSFFLFPSRNLSLTALIYLYKSLPLLKSTNPWVSSPGGSSVASTSTESAPRPDLPRGPGSRWHRPRLPGSGSSNTARLTQGQGPWEGSRE